MPARRRLSNTPWRPCAIGSTIPRRSARIAAPTLIIAGESDVLVPPAQSQEMHKSIRGSTISIIPGAGHMAPMEQPQQVSRAIRQFLTTLGS